MVPVNFVHEHEHENDYEDEYETTRELETPPLGLLPLLPTSAISFAWGDSKSC